MPLAPSTTSASPSSPAAPPRPCAPPRLKLPESSRIPILPPKPDFAAVAEAATRTETNLLRWLDATPEPTIEQIGISAQAVWRLAAVRKTLSLVGSKTKRLIGQVPKQLTQTMQELDRLMAQLDPPKPKPPTVPPPKSSLKPLPPLPQLPPLPPLPPLFPPQPREAAPKAYAARKQTEKVTPRPVAVCPELHSPMHTVQAAERQVNQLCKEAGLPSLDPSPNTPAAAPEAASSSIETAPATPETPAPASQQAPAQVVRGIRDYPRAIEAYYHVNLLDGCPIIVLPNHAQFPPPT
jgi:hypothetical protein